MYRLTPETKERFQRVLGLHLPSFLDYNIIHQSILPALIDIHCGDAKNKFKGVVSQSFISDELDNYNWLHWHTGDIYVAGSLQEIVEELNTLLLKMEKSLQKEVS